MHIGFRGKLRTTFTLESAEICFLFFQIVPYHKFRRMMNIQMLVYFKYSYLQQSNVWNATVSICIFICSICQSQLRAIALTANIVNGTIKEPVISRLHTNVWTQSKMVTYWIVLGYITYIPWTFYFSECEVIRHLQLKQCSSKFSKHIFWL